MAFNADQYISVIVNQIGENFQSLYQAVGNCETLLEAQKEYLSFDMDNGDIDKFVELHDKVALYRKSIDDLVCNYEDYSIIEPLSVGLFGEWGSGKTHLLKLIQNRVKHIQLEEKSLPKEEKQFPQTTIPVFFNAWRFEKEEHLIVPLFQTLLASIELFEKEHFGERVKRELGRTKERLKLLAFSLVKGLRIPTNIKTTAANLLQGDLRALLDFVDSDEVKKAFEKQSSEAFISKENLEELLRSDRIESVYMSIPQWIEKITVADNINFVFLIDDLDRCLPENTLKMLESIKLFLDVPSCAFVLAIDDDVVERGVVHHYRDYLNNNHSENHELPITGHEYLEKMVQLPFRIPVIDVANVRAFLEANYATSLFECLEDKELISKEGIEGRDSVKKSEELMSFFAKTIPAKPRKIKRTAMLFDTKLKIYDTLKTEQKLTLPLNHMLLAKITLLELFAPKLLRFIQNNGYQRIYNRLGHFRGVDREEKLISLFDKEAIDRHIDNEESNYTPKEKDLFRRLMKIVEEGATSRMMFDLDMIFDKIEKSEDLKVNIELKESAVKSSNKPKEEVSILSDTFWEKIFRKNDETSWHDAFDDNELFEEGRALLSQEAIDELSSRVKRKEGFCDNPKWLMVIAEYMIQGQFVKLLEEIYPYKMSPYQTTFEEYDKYCEATGVEKPDDNGWGRGKRPVINVSWEDAVAYVSWLSEEEGMESRLPTSYEWYLACNVGAKTEWCFGDDESLLEQYAWYDKNSNQQTHPVGEKKPNALGLYDMHGNVWEWCVEWYDDKKERKVLCGGSWYYSANDSRSSILDRNLPTSRNIVVGFRILRTLS